jgi:cell wall-associated NlpC family hydrolase
MIIFFATTIASLKSTLPRASRLFYTIAVASVLLASHVHAQQPTPAAPKTDSSAYTRLAASIHSILRDVEKVYAPDKRTALFAVTTVADTKNNAFIKLKGETNVPAAKQELMRRLKDAAIANVTDEIDVLPAAVLGDKNLAIVNLAVCNLRSRGADAAELASQGLLGYPVKVLKKSDNGWFLVQTPDEYIAWVDRDALHITNEAGVKAWTSAKKVFVTTELAFTTVAPDRAAARVTDVTKGNVLKLLDKTATGFFHVEYPDGQTAYLPPECGVEWDVWAKNVKTFATEPDAVIATARLCMGIPYLWGGTSVKGMDCSGFTRTVFTQHGLVLPRDASQQAFVGDSVSIMGVAATPQSFADLKTGDLLFFGRKATDSTREAVTHVGLYIGGGEYIHESGRVRLNSLDRSAKHFNEGRLATLLRARRILNASNKAGIKTVEEIVSK